MDKIIELIEGCKNQQAQSQKMFYETFYGYLLKIAFRYVYRYEDAVDVTHDAFVKIFQNIYKFIPEGDYPERLLMGWMKRIVINTSIDILRKNNMSPEIGGIPEHVWEQPDKSPGADQQLLYKEIISYIKNLPPMYRVVFNMYIIDGCTHVEIAKKLGISVGTSKSNLSRARGIMQKFIKENEKVKSYRILENYSQTPEPNLNHNFDLNKMQFP